MKIGTFFRSSIPAATCTQRDEEDDYFATEDDNGDAQDASTISVKSFLEDYKPLPPVRRKSDQDDEEDDLLKLESQTIKPANKPEGQKGIVIAGIKNAGSNHATATADDSKDSIRLPEKRKRDEDNDEPDLLMSMKRKAAAPLSSQKKSTAGGIANKIKVIVDR